jgi:transposase
MPLKLINKFADFQDIQIISVEKDRKNYKAVLFCEPFERVQSCPQCGKTDRVILKGKRRKNRIVRHLKAFKFKTYLSLPNYQLFCTSCQTKFTHTYSVAANGSSYSYEFCHEVANSLLGTTVKKVAKLYKIPYTTCERMVKNVLFEMTKIMQMDILNTARNTDFFVLGIDDFAIRKGHTYNTGFHDVRNGTMLFVVKGRRFDELSAYKKLVANLRRLQPAAIVMDLAKGYHKFAREHFPNAIRIADRFHVNRFLTDALHDVRKRISKTLTVQSRKLLKSKLKLLEKRNNSLTDEEKNELNLILSLSSELAQTYKLKEDFADWYEMSSEYNSLPRLKSLIKRGYSLGISEVSKCMNTFKRWKREISNYHICHATNAGVEGRNNKIKTLQRMCYFLRNRKAYTARIYQEINYEKWKFEKEFSS